MKTEDKGKGKLKYTGVVVVLAFLAGIYLASATTVITDIQVLIGNITIGPDEIQVGNTKIGGESINTTDINISRDLGVAGKVGIGTTTTQQKLTLGSGSNIATEMALPTGVSATCMITGGSLVGTPTEPTFSYKIVALDGIGTTIGSAEASCLMPSPTSFGSVSISWNGVPGAKSYRVYGRHSPQDQYWTTTALSYVDDGTNGISGNIPTVTTAYVNKISASGNSWFLGGNLGIGTTSPGANLEVDGSIKIVDGNQGANKVLTSDANGLASWQASGGIPSGVIVMWSGSVANIPDGWHLCDGTSGTPDLRNKFIVGAGGSYSVNNTGGSSTHTHGVGSYAGPSHTHTGPSHTHGVGSYTSPTSGSTAITVAQMPAHTHGLKGHANAGGEGPNWFLNVFDSVYQNTEATGGGEGHTHTGGAITGTSAAGGTGATGAGGTGAITGTSASASSLPPYYALAYIMKL